MNSILLIATLPAVLMAQFAPPSITTSSPLPTGTVNQPYSTTLQCTNCTNAVWSAANLPGGLSINSSSGTISGTPTTAGGYGNVIVSLQVIGAGTVTKPFSITINAPPLSLLNSSFPNGKVNTAYATQNLAASGGVPPYSFSITSGSLPPGLSVSGAALGGTPTSAGTYPFTLTVTDSQGTTANGNFSITVTPAGALAITSTSFPNSTVNVQYPSQTLSATGGYAPYTWAVSTGLPPGLGLSQSGTTWTITGTPTATGTYAFILTVYDSAENSANLQLSITITSTGPAAAIVTTSLPAGTVNVGYSGQLVCTNCNNWTWSITSGTLPTGLTLNGGTGLITGTPTITQTSTFQVTLTAPSLGTNAPPTLTAILSITINAGGLSITTASLPVASQNTKYNSPPLTATGGTPPYTWSLTSTSNDGLTIGATTGVISGTPTATGQFTINVQVTDTTGLTATKFFTITVSTALSIFTTTLPNATLNAVYPTQTLSAGGGQPPYRWVIVTTGPGNLPPGLTLDSVFGRISGTPTSSGVFPFMLMVTDNNGNTAAATLSITVGGNIVISPSTLPAATVGTAYSQPLTATGGTGPYAWSISTGSLPVGLTLNAAGVIGGTPTLPGSASFTVVATDSTGISGQAALSITVNAPVNLTITTTSLPDATIGVAYSQPVSATGGTTPYNWSISAGTLPAGLTISATTGVISGTPTTAANSSFTVTVTDAGKGTASQALTIATAAALTVTPTSLPAAVVGTAYTQKFTASGGKSPYTFALTGTLPAGFTFTASTATISGTAPAAESGSFTLTVTDASSRTLSVPLTLTASASPLTVTPTTLPTATVGVAYSQKLTASGGVAPYTFALSLGSLPSGFTFTASTATIAGTATAAESGNFTITVTDSAGTTVNDGLTLIVNNPPAPTTTVAVNFPGVNQFGFNQQPAVAVAIAAPYPVDIAGSITLTFAPSVTPSTGVDDAMIQFSSGGRVVNFTIPAGSTTPATTTTCVNGSLVGIACVMTGTTAGTVTLTTSLTAGGVSLTGPKPTTIVNNPNPPSISSVSFQQTPGGITVTVVGFSSTRDMVSGLFTFAPATNANVTFTNAQVTVPLTTAFSTWWSNTAQSNPYGTQFTLTAPFSLSTQSTAVVSVTVTLTNSQGASKAVSLSQ